MGEVPELGEHERRALVVGQLREVGEQRPQVVPALDLGRQELGRGLGQLVDLLAPAAEHAEAAVAGDGVQPRPQRDLLARAQQVAVRGQERVLDGVLGLLDRAEHVAAEREHAPVVADVERLERRLGAAAQELDEPLVGGEPEEARG